MILVNKVFIVVVINYYFVIVADDEMLKNLVFKMSEENKVSI